MRNLAHLMKIAFFLLVALCFRFYLLLFLLFTSCFMHRFAKVDFIFHPLEPFRYMFAADLILLHSVSLFFFSLTNDKYKLKGAFLPWSLAVASKDLMADLIFFFLFFSLSSYLSFHFDFGWYYIFFFLFVWKKKISFLSGTFNG